MVFRTFKNGGVDSIETTSAPTNFTRDAGTRTNADAYKGLYCLGTGDSKCHYCRGTPGTDPTYGFYMNSTESENHYTDSFNILEGLGAGMASKVAYHVTGTYYIILYITTGEAGVDFTDYPSQSGDGLQSGHPYCELLIPIGYNGGSIGLVGYKVTNAVGDAFVINTPDNFLYGIMHTWTEHWIRLTPTTLYYSAYRAFDDLFYTESKAGDFTATHAAIFGTQASFDVSKQWFIRRLSEIGHGYMIIPDQDVDFSTYYDLQETEIYIFDQDLRKIFHGMITTPHAETDGVRLDFKEITEQLVDRKCKRDYTAEKGTVTETGTVV